MNPVILYNNVGWGWDSETTLWGFPMFSTSFKHKLKTIEVLYRLLFFSSAQVIQKISFWVHQ